MNATQLDRLRRQAHTKAVTVHTALIDRPTPWRLWQSIARQLRAIGFHDIDSPEQSGRELQLMISFLTAWLDLLPIADGIIWNDPDDDEQC